MSVGQIQICYVVVCVLDILFKYFMTHFIFIVIPTDTNLYLVWKTYILFCLFVIFHTVWPI